jgi:hypothetical protein
METTKDQMLAAASSWLVRWCGLAIAAAMVAAAAALAVGQHWLAVADLVPLLYVLPCAVMMFVCMKGMGHGQQTDTAQIPARNDTPAPSDLRKPT